ncbi:MAG: peroxiredoxin family protein [Anaerolineae bacterium]|nr:peroxiredoxin family protein [Anaerolineae bacterium]
MDNNIPKEKEKRARKYEFNNTFPIYLLFLVLLQPILSLLILKEVKILRLPSSPGITNVENLLDGAGLTPGSVAPNFVLENTDGKLVSLNEFAGSKVLLMFSSPDCPYCVELFPDLNNVNNDLMSKDIVFIMLSVGSHEENYALKVQQNFNFEILSIKKEQFDDYLIPGTPFFSLIDEKGEIMKIYHARDGKGILDIINEFIGKD